MGLLTGGNRGDVVRRLHAAERLAGARIGRVVAASRLYESAPWGFRAAERFVNQALVVETTLRPLEVLDAAQAIERELGRDRAAEAAERLRTGERYASRAIDVDILFYDDAVIRSERLTLPHARLAERPFALEPLGEAAPAWRHPLLGATARELLERLKKE